VNAPTPGRLLATYVPLSREPIHGDEYGDYPQRLGVMARRDREAAVVFLHLNDILIRPGGWPDLIDHCLSLTADEAEQLAGALLETAKLVGSTPPDGA
jgi:hypothetical protein